MLLNIDIMHQLYSAAIGVINHGDIMYRFEPTPHAVGLTIDMSLTC